MKEIKLVDGMIMKEEGRLNELYQLFKEKDRDISELVLKTNTHRSNLITYLRILESNRLIEKKQKRKGLKGHLLIVWGIKKDGDNNRFK